MSSMPLAALHMVNQPHVDWGYKTVPQNNSCLALNNQVGRSIRTFNYAIMLKKLK